jgi:hypothetical protein
VKCWRRRETKLTIPHEEEKELMKGMKGIDVTEVGPQEELLPVYGPDGVQQRVSLGTNMISEVESSVGVMPQQVFNHSPKPKADDHELSMLKIVGPSRNNEKMKRRRMSPYSRPMCHVGDGSYPEVEKANALSNRVAVDGRSGDHVMMDEGLGFLALSSNPADPTPLMGPQEEARQEK